MTEGISQGFPHLPTPLVDDDGFITPSWRYLLLNLWNRTGQGTGAIDIQPALDVIGSTPGDFIMRGSAEWIALAPGAQYRVLRMGATFPAWGLLDGNSFAAQSANQFFSGPTSGSAVPGFRSIVAGDIPYKPATVALAVAAAGTVQGDATPLTAQWNEVTSGVVNAGVIASNAVVGIGLRIFNWTLNTIKIYPPVGGQINNLGVNAALSLGTTGAVSLSPVSATQMYSQ